MSLYDIAAGLKPLDLGQTLGRLDAMQANRLQSDALRAQLADREAAAAAYRQYGPAAARGDETALSALAGIQPGYAVAAPQLREIRQGREFNALFPGGATQAAPPAGGATVGIAPRSPNATPAALPGLAGAPEQWRGAIAASAQRAGVDPDDLANLIATESNWNPNAVSPRGAVGLGQHMPATASELGIDPRDPQQSIDGAARYLAQQQQRFGRTGGFAAYNAGPGRVAGAVQNGELNLASLPPETQQYVTRLAGGEGASIRQPLATSIQGAPPPELFARVARLAAAGNEPAQRFVQMWSPFMLRQTPEVPETWNPMTPDQRTQYGVPSAVPAQISSRGQIRLPGTPQTNVSIDQRGETSFANAYNKDLAEQASALAATPRRSAQTIARLDRAEALLDRFTTGAGANARLSVGALAQQLGVPDSVMSNLGLDRNAVAAGESIRGLTNQLLIGMLGSGGFPAQNFSNADRESLERALVSVANTPGGNRLIIATLRNAARVDQQVGQEWLRYSQRNGATADSYQRFLTERVPEITQGLDPYAGIFEAVQSANLEAPPAGGAAVPGPGGQGTATPPPAAPRVGEVRDGYRFRGGNPADQAAWEAVR